jgi:hypothetical protein
MVRRLIDFLGNQEVKSISASVMPFKMLFYCATLLLVYFQPQSLLLLTPSEAYASERLLEATVAVVEDEVITLTEFNEKYEFMKKRFPGIKKEEVLDAMINRLILLREARLSRLSETRTLIPVSDEDRIIDEYIDIKIRSSVRITEDEVRQYYEQHKDDFKGAVFQDLAESIEELLIEKKTNEFLQQHLEELRKRAYIVINGDRL